MKTDNYSKRVPAILIKLSVAFDRGTLVSVRWAFLTGVLLTGAPLFEAVLSGRFCLVSLHPGFVLAYRKKFFVESEMKQKVTAYPIPTGMGWELKKQECKKQFHQLLIETYQFIVSCVDNIPDYIKFCT